jgi:TctA family transporter
VIGELHTIRLVRIVLILCVVGEYFRLKQMLDSVFVLLFLLLVQLVRKFVRPMRMFVEVVFLKV